ncbi:MAG: ISKra4 family transposase, partial [Acetobacteraceae bacterium]
MPMHVRILLEVTADAGTPGVVEEVAAFEKKTEQAEDLGLSIAEAKSLLEAVQTRTVTAQVADWSEGHRRCEACGQSRRIKGSNPIVFRTLYGDITLRSPRLHRCSCQESHGPLTVSPLHELIPDHVAPEPLYLEGRWGSLAPYT